MAGAEARAYNGGLGQKPAKSSLAFDSPAAEQNVPDSGYVAVHTGVNHKAFCNQVSDCNANRQKCSVVTHMWRSYVRRVWGEGNFNCWEGLVPQTPPCSRPCLQYNRAGEIQPKLVFA